MLWFSVTFATKIKTEKNKPSAHSADKLFQKHLQGGLKMRTVLSFSNCSSSVSPVLIGDGPPLAGGTTRVNHASNNQLVSKKTDIHLVKPDPARPAPGRQGRVDRVE